MSEKSENRRVILDENGRPADLRPLPDASRGPLKPHEIEQVAKLVGGSDEEATQKTRELIRKQQGTPERPN